MAITITVPADSKTPGTAQHTSDHNVISDALTTLGSSAANTAGDTYTGPVTFADGSKITSAGYVGKDTVTYGPLGQAMVFAAGQTVSSTGFINLNGLAFTVGVGTYLFRCELQLNAAASAGQWQVQLAFPGTTSDLSYGFKYVSAAGVEALSVNKTTFASALAGPATSVAGAYWAIIKGKMTTTVGGNLHAQGLTTVGADTWQLFTASYLEVIEAA